MVEGAGAGTSICELSISPVLAFPFPISSSIIQSPSILPCFVLSTHVLPDVVSFSFSCSNTLFDTLTLFLAIDLPPSYLPSTTLTFLFSLFCVSSTFTHLARSLTFNGVCCVEIGIIVRREAGYGVRAVRGRCEGEVSLAYAGEGDQADVGVAEPDVA